MAGSLLLRWPARLALLVLVLLCGTTTRGSDTLEQGFLSPPASAKPRTFWFWMNGHVSRDGITRDLEAMARVGIGGVLIYDGGQYLPAGPVEYLKPEWRELMVHAMNEGKRLGVEIGMHNGPGWSSSGGPWITPEQAMQQLVWTETTVRGGGAVDLVLRQPQTNHGFYRDALVLAFPAAEMEKVPYEESIRSLATSQGWVAKDILRDGSLETAIPVAKDEAVTIEFAEPTAVHAITVNVRSGRSFPRFRLEVSEDGTTFKPVTTLGSGGRHGIHAPGARSFPAVRGRFFKVVASGASELAELHLHRSPRLEDWIYKANFSYRIGRQIELPQEPLREGAVEPGQVLDLSTRMDRSGRLNWEAPPGAWTVIRFGHTPTGQLNVSASKAGTGLESDKFSAEATEHHFNTAIAKLLEDAGPAAAAFKGVSIDSYEAGMQNWSARFPQEFKTRAGYDLYPYLAGMTGRIVVDAAVTERFLHDIRRVQADLMTEAYFETMGRLARAKGLTYYVEGYGQGMFDELPVSGLSDIPMTEFWTRTPWAPNRTVKLVSSAAHIYGKSIVSSEAFTGEEFTSRWLDYPYSLKVLGDDMFAWGVNLMVFHRYAHQPHPTAMPGMAMGPWGFHFDRTNTWFDYSTGWLTYLARCQQLLRQGTYVADVLYFVGERPPNNPQFVMPTLPAGFNYDLVSAEVLLHRTRVEGREFVLENGARYKLLALHPELTVATPELLRKLRQFAEAGGVIMGPKPQHSATLRGYPQSESEVRLIAGLLWDGTGANGRSSVMSARPLADAIQTLGLTPDFTYAPKTSDVTLSWIHRKLPEGDLYFVANRQRLPAEFVGSFRVKGLRPEIWDPQSGQISLAAVFEMQGDRTRVAMRLEAAESKFILFRKPVPDAAPAAWVEKENVRILDLTTPVPSLSKVTQTFTMAFWAKPDTELRLMPKESSTGKLDETGKFYAIAAAEGDLLFGPGHTMAGVAVGRNGVYVVERAREQSPAVLVTQRPIAGWTHFAVVYRDGTPRLYIDGKFVREGVSTGAVVHPGVGSPPPAPDTQFHFTALAGVARASKLPLPPSQGRAYLFEGHLTTPQLMEEALSDEAVAALAAKGLPLPEGPSSVVVAADLRGSVQGQFWESGQYRISNGNRVRVDVPAPVEISSPWKVVFPPDRGAPENITLPALASLHRHPDAGVKHFSGTATYRNTFMLSGDVVAKGNRVFIDLGRVEVAAEVLVNGRTVGTAWKAPYRLEITQAVRAGENSLEVRVANLWANRLIGDEQLPAENTYAAGSERGITEVPAWYLRGEPKPTGGRTTFVTWHFYDANEPLLESGLLGPVRVLFSVDAVFE